MSFMHFILGLAIAYAVSEILSRFVVHFVPKPHRPKWTELIRYHHRFLGRKGDLDVLVRCRQCSATATISPEKLWENWARWLERRGF
ncbi:MAG: hypothetical protein V1897_15550 [Pseudomonadota bacterium]